MGVQDNNTKNDTKSNHPKGRTLRKLKKFEMDLTGVPCSGWKSTSGKKSVDLIQSWPPQLALELGLNRPPSFPSCKNETL